MAEERQTNQGKSPQLRKCSMCGNELSPYSLFCRNCGHPQGRPLALALLILFLVVLLALYVAFTIFCACNIERFQASPPAAPSVKRLAERRHVGIWAPGRPTGYESGAIPDSVTGRHMPTDPAERR